MVTPRSQHAPLPRIVAIGAGNVATHLLPALEGAGVGEVVQVWSRTAESARALASRLWEAEPVTDLKDVIPDADIYIVSLVDDAVPGVLGQLPHNDALWLHTSGSLPIEVLSAMSRRTGVFYPLQTFSRSTPVDMSQVPVFVEGSTPGIEARIMDMARQVTERVYSADSPLRKRMHIAAVFACNFTNHLWAIADDLLRADGLDLPSVLGPLLQETLRKALASPAGPAAGQTGPAVRGDEQVMSAHKAALTPELAEVYDLLSRSIQKRHTTDK